MIASRQNQTANKADMSDKMQNPTFWNSSAGKTLPIGGFLSMRSRLAIPNQRSRQHVCFEKLLELIGRQNLSFWSSSASKALPIGRFVSMRGRLAIPNQRSQHHVFVNELLELPFGAHRQTNLTDRKISVDERRIGRNQWQ